MYCQSGVGDWGDQRSLRPVTSFGGKQHLEKEPEKKREAESRSSGRARTGARVLELQGRDSVCLASCCFPMPSPQWLLAGGLCPVPSPGRDPQPPGAVGTRLSVPASCPQVLVGRHRAGPRQGCLTCSQGWKQVLHHHSPPPGPLQLRGGGEGLTHSLRTSHQLWLVLPGLSCPMCPAYRGLPLSVTVGGQGRGCHSLPHGPVALGPRDRGPSAVAGLGHDWPSPSPCPQVKDGAGHFLGC